MDKNFYENNNFFSKELEDHFLSKRGVFDLSRVIQEKTNLIQFITHETIVALAHAKRASQFLGRSIYRWDIYNGLRICNYDHKLGKMIFEVVDEKDELGLKDPIMSFQYYIQNEDTENSILIIEDSDLTFFNNGGNPIAIAAIRDFYNSSYFKDNKAIIFLQTSKVLPNALSKIIYTYEVPLPDENDLLFVFINCCKMLDLRIDTDIDFLDLESVKDINTGVIELKKLTMENITNKIVKNLISLAKGFTIMEAQNLFLKVLLDNMITKSDWNESNLEFVKKEKEEIIKKSGHLEYYSPMFTSKDIGGMDNLLSWIKNRSKAFSDEAKEFGLPAPKGILLLGIPGTGKSLSAKMLSNEWNQPLIRLDIGKVFAGLVGESESNMRQALKVIEAVAPCILWIDEIEKGLSGMKSSGSTDGGTTSRVLGTFLTWMQDRTAPVFIIATANDISGLPPELLRKGRVDEIFFVDLPVKSEREDILKIHLSKFKQKLEDFDIEKLASLSKGFSGAELEEVVKEGMFLAFNSEDKKLTTDLLEKAIKETYPLSTTMSENIKKMKDWAKNRARMASSLSESVSKKDKTFNKKEIKNDLDVVRDSLSDKDHDDKTIMKSSMDLF